MSVYVDLPFAPLTEIEERVGWLVDLESGSVEAGARVGVAVDWFSLSAGARCRFVLVVDWEHLPVGNFEWLCSSSVETDGVGNSLVVLDGSAEIDASHCFDENGNLVLAFDSREFDSLPTRGSVGTCYGLVVDEDDGVVV